MQSPRLLIENWTCQSKKKKEKEETPSQACVAFGVYQSRVVKEV